MVKDPEENHPALLEEPGELAFHRQLDKHCPAPPLAQVLLLQPIHPTPAISHSHLVLVLQRPSIEDNLETEVSPEGQLIFKDGHHFLMPSAHMFPGTGDQSVECCKGNRELESHTFPIPQGEAYTPISPILSFSALTGLPGCCAEKDQPIHHLPNHLSFQTTLSRPSMGRESERERLWTPTTSLSGFPKHHSKPRKVRWRRASMHTSAAFSHHLPLP